VLLVYLNDNIDPDKADEDKTSQERHLEQTIGRINDFFGGKVLSEINTKLCKGYVKTRPGPGGARRDLEILRAAINHHSAENLHYGKVSVWLPEKGEARDRWLTRSEAAVMIWKAYRYREVQTIHVGPNKGQKVITDRRPLRHVARFLLIGCYTGTRAGAIASAAKKRAPGKSFVDLENGVYYRKPVGKKQTNKRQPPAPIPPRLLAHLRRWDRLGIAQEHFVEYNGKPVLSVKKAFRKVVKLGKIEISDGNVTPHTLRHTAATWLMQRGVNLWTAAGYLGMTVEVLERTYGHHHPDHLAEAVEAITTKKPRKNAVS
jgi:integrase